MYTSKSDIQILLVGRNRETDLLGSVLASLNYNYICCDNEETEKFLSIPDSHPRVAFLSEDVNKSLLNLIQSLNIKIIPTDNFNQQEIEELGNQKATYPFDKSDIKFLIETKLIELKYEEKLQQQKTNLEDIMLKLTQSNVSNVLLGQAMKKFVSGESLVNKQGGFRKILCGYMESLVDITNSTSAFFARYDNSGNCTRFFSNEKDITPNDSLITHAVHEYADEIYYQYSKSEHSNGKTQKLFPKEKFIDDQSITLYAIPLNSKTEIYGITILVKQKTDSNEQRDFNENIIEFLAMEIEQVLERYLLNRELSRKSKEVKTTNERLEYVLRSSPVVLFAFNAKTFSINFISKNVEDILGYSSDLLKSNANFFWKLIHPDDSEKALSDFKSIYKFGKCIREYRLRCSDNKYKWVHDEMRIVAKSDGSKEMFGYFVDIGEQIETQHTLRKTNRELKTAYDNLQAAKNQLLQSEKMASIGQLAAGVAHEINNPVGYISSNLSSLTRYVDDLFNIISCYESSIDANDSIQKIKEKSNELKEDLDLDFIRSDLPELLNQSQEGVSRVKKIVQDLKDFSHVEESDWKIDDLHHGLDSTLNIVNNEIKYKAEVIKDYGEIPPVECIISQLNQVFMNMLVNAAHAIEESGTITISTEQIDDNVIIKFSDTGQGIKEENVKRLFDPFFTTKPVGKGTGLGLSLSYGIIERHGGSIEVESTLGKGTTFKITIPINQPHENEEDEVLQPAV